MEIISKKCVNSNWIARFLSENGQECCECFGECKVQVKNNRGYKYILTEGEIRTLEKFEAEEMNCKLEHLVGRSVKGEI